MTRKSRREIARELDALDGSNDASVTRAELWRGYITGEIPPGEYSKRRGGV